MERSVLRILLTKHFNLDELQTLCFDLNIKYENIPGTTLEAKSRELIDYCERQNLVDELQAAIVRLRPNLQNKESVTDSIRIDDHLAIENFETINPPAVTRPTNLSFDVFTFNGWPASWFNSVGFVMDVSNEYRAKVVVRPDDGFGSCVMFWHSNANENIFGSLMQRCPAKYLAGKVIRIQAEIKSSDVENWAGMWVRADGEIIPDLIFDNMARRPIKGTTPWQTYIVETALPEETSWINYGVVLTGKGTIWVDSFRILVWTNSGKWEDI